MEYALNNPTSSPVMPPTCSPGSVTAGACMMQIIKISKKQQFTIPSKFRKKSNIKEGSEVLIKTQDNELIIYPPVSDPIKEGSGLFGKETLDSREQKELAETSHVISKV